VYAKTNIDYRCPLYSKPNNGITNNIVLQSCANNTVAIKGCGLYFYYMLHTIL